MKLSTQEKIRMAELIALISGGVASKFLGDSDYIQLINLTAFPYFLDIMTSFRTQQMTDEWKELKQLDEKIISNTASVIDNIGNCDPIGIFATYIYLYRKGLLSYDKKFVYDSDMKDFASLLSVDVYRGKGVCRSIASTLTNIYKKSGYDARTLLVSTNSKAIKNNVHLSKVDLKSSVEGRSFSKIIGTLTKVIHIPNHAITLVNNGTNSFKLDPTNDCMLTSGKLNKLLSPSDSKGVMKNYALFNLLYSTLGFIDNDISIVSYSKGYKLPDIDMSEYTEAYLKAVEICNQNQDIFEYFYEDNKPLYETVNDISEKQKNYIKRLIPIIPDFNKYKK